MNQSEKLSLLKDMTGESNNAILLAYLNIAGNEVINRAYPFDNTQRNVPERYESNPNCGISP